MSIKNITDTFLGNKPREEQHSEIIKPSVTLFEWEAPDRLFTQHSREFYRKIAVILMFFGLLLLFLQDYIVVAVLGAVFFVVYIFHTIPPQKIIHKITTNGLSYASQHLYRWIDLKSFYIEKRDGLYVLTVNTVDTLPGKLFMILDPAIDRDKLFATLNERLSVVEEPEDNIYENLMRKISSRMKLS